MSDQKGNEVVKLTKLWIERFVIGLRLCPFAHFSFYDEKIQFEISAKKQLDECLIDLIEFMMDIKLKGEDLISNAFLIFDESLTFEFMLTLKEKADVYFEDTKYDGIFQTVVFHPKFQFADERFLAPGNFINRSPFPMIHVLRVQEVSRAIDDTPNVDEIPFINKKLLEAINIKNITEVFKPDFKEKVKPFLDL